MQGRRATKKKAGRIPNTQLMSLKAKLITDIQTSQGLDLSFAWIIALARARGQGNALPHHTCYWHCWSVHDISY